MDTGQIKEQLMKMVITQENKYIKTIHQILILILKVDLQLFNLPAKNVTLIKNGINIPALVLTVL